MKGSVVEIKDLLDESFEKGKVVGVKDSVAMIFKYIIDCTDQMTEAEHGRFMKLANDVDLYSKGLDGEIAKSK